MGLFHFMLPHHSSSLRRLRVRTQTGTWRQKLKERPRNALLWLAQLVFLDNPGPPPVQGEPCLQWAGPSNFNRQSRKCTPSPELLTGQPGGGSSSIEVSSSQKTWVCVKLKNAHQRRHPLHCFHVITEVTGKHPPVCSAVCYKPRCECACVYGHKENREASFMYGFYMGAREKAGWHRGQEEEQKYSLDAWVCCSWLAPPENDCLGQMIRDLLKMKLPCRPMEHSRPSDPGECSSFITSLLSDSQNPEMARYWLDTFLFSASVVSLLPCLTGRFSFLCCPQLQERGLGLGRGDRHAPPLLSAPIWSFKFDFLFICVFMNLFVFAVLGMKPGVPIILGIPLILNL